MQWNLTGDRPIYLQLCEQITLRLVSGAWPPGGRLPSVRELAVDAGGNPNTMQRALAQLEADGLVVTNRTAGRTVTEDEGVLAHVRHELANEKMEEYLEGMATLGYTAAEAIALLQGKETQHG